MHISWLLVGKAYAAMKNKNAALTTPELWDHLTNNYEAYGFDNYVALHEKTGKPALIYMQGCVEKPLRYKRFEDMVSEYRQGKRTLPTV